MVGFVVTLVKKTSAKKKKKICFDARAGYEGKDKKTRISVTFRFPTKSVGSSDITVEWKRVDTCSPYSKER